MGRIIRTSDNRVTSNSKFDYILLATLIGADMNSTSDQLFSWTDQTPASYIIKEIIASEASLNLTTAAGGIYDAVTKTGNVIVAASQVYTALSTSTKYVGLTLATYPTTDIASSSTLYLSLTTAQGAAANANFYIYGIRLS